MQRARRVRSKPLKRYLVTFLSDEEAMVGDAVKVDSRHVDCDFIDRTRDGLVIFVEQEEPSDEPQQKLAIPLARFLRAETIPAH